MIMGNDITRCHPRLQSLAAQLKTKCAAKGYQIAIGESFRSAAEQDALYAQGRTKPGAIITNVSGSSYGSMHQWGIAFDFYRNDGRGAYNTSGNFFEAVGAIGKGLGLEWGGDWKSIVDRPHFQLPDWGSTPGLLKQKYGNFAGFKKTWPSTSGATGSGSGSAGSSTTSKSKDNWVLRLQTELKSKGYDPGALDGIAGPNTLKGCPTIRLGTRGGLVKLIQERLSQAYKIGIGISGIDGVFGKDTQAAVMELQKQKKLVIDGIIGKNTWRALLGL